MKKTTDVFKKAYGDMFGAKGDVFKAKGDVFKAKGDVFNNGNGLTGVEDQNRLPGDTPDATSESLKNAQDKKGFFYFMEKTLGLADQVTDIKNKWEMGTTIEEPGVSYEITPSGEAPKSNAIWYVASAVIGLLVIVGVVSYMKKKK